MKKQDLLSKSLWFHLCILYLSKCFRLIPVFFFFLLITSASSSGKSSEPKYIIIMIADGWGAKQIEATAQYTGTLPMYQVGPAWREYWMSTFPIEGSYETTKAWSEFNYVLQGPITDSAASATALYSGKKTQNSRISVSGDGVDRLLTIGEIATKQGMGTGAVSTVPVSHATPGAWIAHNDDRNNVYAIASEGFFNDPNATGMSTELYYGGGHGSTFPSADVIIGSRGAKYIDSPIITKLRKESVGGRRNISWLKEIKETTVAMLY
ncbi:MAG: alkaline phosphatase [Candidatus Scalinduaceae bacterium]